MRRTTVISGLAGAAPALLLASTMLAAAADMPLVTKAPRAAAVTDWRGFYFGVHAGAGSALGRGDYDEVGDHGPIDFAGRGVIGGVQGGYNAQFGRWVLGLELDASWAGLKDSRTDGDGDSQELRTRFLGSARLRNGLTVDNVLLYSTFGLAYGKSRFTVTGGDVPSPATRNLDAWGLVSGFGAEWAVAPNWSVRGEYLYYRFDKRADIPALTNDSDGNDYVKLDGVHVARLAVNYRFGGPTIGTPSAAPAADWRGFYVGLHGGYGWSRQVGAYDEVGDSGSFDINPRGGVFGGHAGYNWQSGAWVYGVEADATWSGMTNSRVDREAETEDLKTSRLASLRGRFGIAADDRLTYLTAGVGYGRSLIRVTGSDVPSPAERAFSSWGAVVGAGTEWAFAPGWSARLESLVYLFDHKEPLTALTNDSDAQDYLRQGSVGVIRAGVTYRFR